MTISTLAGRPRRGGLRDAFDLVEALGVPFSDEQLAAITAPLEPTVIIAGAGSGKTTVMAARVVWLVGSGQVSPEHVLGLTFTRKAAAELAQRVRDALVTAAVLSPDGVDDDGEQVIVTYDSFAARLVGEHGLWLGYEPDPLMITGAARHRLASRVVASAAGPFEHLTRLRPETVTERVLALDGAVQSHLADERAIHDQARSFLSELANAPLNRYGNIYASVRDAEAAARERLELVGLVSAYAALKRDLGHVEFSDHMAAAAHLADEVPGVGEALRRQYRVVLLDEYQDTSSAQAQLLRGLFSGPTPEQGRGHPVTAVGDPFQAIYGWRGAAASNILEFTRDFPRHDGSPARALPLTVNRRSGPTILAAANRLAAPLRADTTLSYDLSDAHLRAPDGTPPGQIETAALGTWPDEVDWIADRIVEAHTAGEVDRWSDVAILVRRNADIGPLYGALSARDVPAEIVGIGGLLSVPEVADVVSTLRLVDDVTANPDLVRLITGPRWSVGSGDLEMLGRRARELARARDRTEFPGDDPLTEALDASLAATDPTEVASLSEALTDLGDAPVSAEARTRMRAFGAELAMLRRHAGEPIGDLVRRVVTTLGVETELLATGHEGKAATAQLTAFVDAVGAYTEVDADGTLSGFLSYLDAEERYGVGLEQAVPTAVDSVKLLTIHKAKGLEWEFVVVPALCDQTFPSDRVTDNWVTTPSALPAELRGDAASIPHLTDAGDTGFKEYRQALKAEARRAEDRLAYVAVTRARQVLIGTTHFWRVGDRKQRERSPYFLTLATMSSRSDGISDPPPVNPLERAATAVEWPTAGDAEARRQRRRVADEVQRCRESLDIPGAAELALGADDRGRLDAWDDEIDVLLEEAVRLRASEVAVPLPESLTATQVMLAHENPAALAAQLARPMPRPPSRAARFGTRFHEWVLRHYGSPVLIDPDDLLDADAHDDDDDLPAVCEAFAVGQFGDVLPAELEFPFSLTIGGEVVRGRIDAAYQNSPVVPAGCAALVVDWKTGRSRPDPLQLALYRLAWAELRGLPVERVAAAFYHVRTDRLETVTGLPGRDELEVLVSGLGD